MRLLKEAWAGESPAPPALQIIESSWWRRRFRLRTTH